MRRDGSESVGHSGVRFLGPPNLMLSLHRDWALHLCGLFSLCVYVSLARLSHGEAQIQLSTFYLHLGASWSLLLLLYFHYRETRPTPPLLQILVWAVVFRIAGSLSLPIYEDDYYRYLWDGWSFVERGNPYDAPPAAFFAGDNVNPEMQEILDNVNYPYVPTIYSPSLQYLFGLSALFSAGNVYLLKILLIAADLSLVVVLRNVLSGRQLLLLSWCPLLLFECSFNAHPDIVGVFLITLAFLQIQRGRFRTSMVLCAMAAATKIFALIIVPFLIVRAKGRGLPLFLTVLGLLYLPFLAQGTSAEWEGLLVFSREWEFNSALFAIIRLSVGNPAARVAFPIAFIVVYSFLLLRWAAKPENDPPFDLLFGLFFLLSPVINPWYLLWLLPFVCLRPKLWSVTALVAVSLSYVTGANLGSTELSSFGHPTWLRIIAFGLVGLAVLIDAMETRFARSRSLSEFVVRLLRK